MEPTESNDNYDPIYVYNKQRDPEQIIPLRARFQSQSGPPKACTWCLRDGDLRLFRCWQCYSGMPACEKCILIAHGEEPLHWPEEWAGHYWKRITLTELGFVYQQGHEGLECPNPTEPALRAINTAQGRKEIWVRQCLCAELLVERRDVAFLNAERAYEELQGHLLVRQCLAEQQRRIQMAAHVCRRAEERLQELGVDLDF
ncbi:hypothetical protein B0H13DRAFT_2339819 [Mycena leptocephala]|nr:hypothetical protein B0H13DRAFT_2339819 [Mycena leptocephala]